MNGTITNPGQRFDLGYVEGQYYGIWDRQAARLVQQFPLNDEGWQAAWAQWQGMERAGPGTPGVVSPQTWVPGGPPGWQPQGPPWPQQQRQRPGGVTFAAVLLIILGSLSLLFGLLFGLAAALIGGSDLGPLGGAAAGALAVVGILVIALGVVQLIAGIKVLKLSNGWRITGIVFSCIIGALIALGLVGSLAGEDQVASAASIATNVAFLVAYFVIVILLGKNGEAFRRG